MVWISRKFMMEASNIGYVIVLYWKFFIWKVTREDYGKRYVPATGAVPLLFAQCILFATIFLWCKLPKKKD